MQWKFQHASHNHQDKANKPDYREDFIAASQFHKPVMKAGNIWRWLFVLAVVIAILVVCVIQIHNVNLLHSK
jgi:hypothetical protein